MIHRNVSCISGVLIDQGITAITRVGPRPNAGTVAKLGAVILTASEREITVTRMNGHAHKLHCI